MALFKKRIRADFPSHADEVTSDMKPVQTGLTEIQSVSTKTEHVTVPEDGACAVSNSVQESSQVSIRRTETNVESEPTKASRLMPEIYNRMTVCFVCGENAKTGQEFIKNYGGVTCFSCRAFFRRSTQSEKTRAWFCINGEKCSLTVATRLNCKKCRYIKCLEAGMLPEMVLNSDQKKHRFRRHLARDKGQDGRTPNTDSRSADAQQYDQGPKL